MIKKIPPFGQINSAGKKKEEKKMGMNADIAKAKKDCIFFGEYYFPHLTPEKTGEFHKELIKIVEEPENNRLDILAPRGHAKSTWLSIIYPMWKIMKNRDINIIICSDIADQAEIFLRAIKDELERNALLIEHFGEFKPKEKSGGGSIWRAQDITVLRSERGKEPTVVCGGTGKKIIGRRADLIIVDDPLNDENVSSETQRNKTETWFKKTLTPILRPKTGRMIVIGTKKHPLDLHTTLKNNDQYKQFIYEAIKDEKELWPEYWTYELLIKKKKEIGSLCFAQEYQNKDTDKETSLFNEDFVKECIKIDISNEKKRKNEKKYLGIFLPLHLKNGKLEEYKNKLMTSIEIRTADDKKIYVKIILKTPANTIFDMMKILEDLLETEEYEQIAIDSEILHSLYLNNLIPRKWNVRGHDKERLINVYDMIPKIVYQIEREIYVIPAKEDYEKQHAKALKEAFRLYMANEPNELITALCLAEHALRIYDGENGTLETFVYCSYWG
ncbi:MAG: hypothetical protein Q8O92_16235 [Candidatus Latescibacter sp.]|nr:hypothetical protein [Candidatus Latescibacter sp.]